MALALKWVGEPDFDRVALTRLRCYSGSSSRTDKYRDSVTRDPRQKPGDFLLATTPSGEDVGTATALSLHMWVRGARVPCQGVAYVGTIKTARRGGSKDEPGVATQVMRATLDRARERGEVVSALMPFRASYYEHFGYGNAERRTDWTVPMAILPKVDFGGYRFADLAKDAPRMLAAREREFGSGHCEVETDALTLKFWTDTWTDGIGVVDEGADGAIHAFAYLVEHRDGPQAVVEVNDWCADSPEAFQRMLGFLGSLKDQYSFAKLVVPGDLPLNRMLRESQIPHRQVDHPVPVAKPFTRMQVRVLDHKRFIEPQTLESEKRGSVTVTVRESEGTTSRLKLDFDGPHVAVKVHAGEADIEVTDVIWASVVTGDLRASDAVNLGLIRAADLKKASLLDAFAAGRAPFCQEYF
jgi:predicted acetyltransferase